jgi:hypothetical protein
VKHQSVLAATLQQPIRDTVSACWLIPTGDVSGSVYVASMNELDYFRQTGILLLPLKFSRYMNVITFTRVYSDPDEGKVALHRNVFFYLQKPDAANSLRRF